MDKSVYSATVYVLFSLSRSFLCYEDFQREEHILEDVLVTEDKISTLLAFKSFSTKFMKQR